MNLPSMQGDRGVTPGPSIKLSLSQWRELKLELDEFNRRLNEPPEDKYILTRELSGNKIHRYVPISYVQDKLQEFFGIYQIQNFKVQVIANEVIGTLDLLVMHPVLGTWMKSTGAAAVLILQKKGAKPTEIDKKYSNALESGIPHLKSDCIANAAKELGKIFGRDLNRKHQHTFNPELLSSAQRIIDLEEERRVLEGSLQVLEKYKEVVGQYKDADALYKKASAIGDSAREEGLLEQDEQSLRSFMHQHYLFLRQKQNS